MFVNINFLDLCSLNNKNVSAIICDYRERKKWQHIPTRRNVCKSGEYQNAAAETGDRIEWVKRYHWHYYYRWRRQ